MYLTSPSQEKAKFLAAVELAKEQMTELCGKLQASGEVNQAAIMEAHLMMLDDPELRQVILAKIEGGNLLLRRLWLLGRICPAIFPSRR